MKTIQAVLIVLGSTVGALVTNAASIDLKLDATKTGAPISPYIYGQFIEHLGRCIYGGVWAEMLEDRKFYFPITADYSPYRSLTNTAFPVVGASPWQIIGDATAVTMVKEDAFVGDHSPRINSGAGIRQRDLGLVADKSYEGYLWAKPLERRAEIEVALVWGDGASDRVVTKLKFSGGKYSRKTFSFTAKQGTEQGSLEIRVLSGDVLLGPPSLMPGDNIHGMRADTIALLKQLNGTVYRWPGGNFASGYDWRDGIGDRDRRPPRKNPAWTGVEHNDFGTDEFLAFCREIHTEPMIAVNTGFGDAYSAAQWVEYCNATTKTIGGGWRAKNGHKEPYHVKFWCVGNEMFGPWQLGFMQMQHYTLKHNMVVDYMRKVDPTIKLTAVGDLDTINKDYDPDQAKSGKTCSRIMLEQCADHMDLISEHFYDGRVPWKPNNVRLPLLEEVTLLKTNIQHKTEGHRRLQASLTNLNGRIIPIAMDEWNYWHRDYVYGELGCVYDLSDGLGVAEGLHEFYRQSDIVKMAHYAQTVNVIGAIKTTSTAAEMETTGLVLEMYRAHYGQIPLKIERDFAPCDIAAALTQDGKTLTIGVVNPTESEVKLSPSFAGATPTGTATRWHITGKDEFAHNTPGQPRAVDIQETDGLDLASLSVPALSATVFNLPLK